ncbi:MAG: hypothetical protein K2W82_16915 [Candidatus Obscuribacterales bacterium]|nr:hypothetical protein [Candidatus Obscuribacterales bacterium]
MSQPVGFTKAQGFTDLVKKGVRKDCSNGVWIVTFGDPLDAESFAKYVGGFIRRVCPKANTRASSTMSDRHQAYVATQRIQFPWGTVEGAVIFWGENTCGIAIKNEKAGKQIMLPIRPHTSFCTTESGSLYVKFDDGNAFCISVENGVQPCAQALYFALSSTEADRVQREGEELHVSEVPTVGAYPIYGDKAEPGTHGRMRFKQGSFRIGTKIRSITHA